MKILFIAPLRYVASMAFAMESITAFANRGNLVDVLVSNQCDPPFECHHKNVRIYPFKDTGRGMKYFSFLNTALLMAKKQRYDMTVGLSQMGLISAAFIKKCFDTPCIYFNDEIWFGNERPSLLGNMFGYTMKFLERMANREVLFTVTQDPIRGSFVAKANRISTDSLRYLPNSRAGNAQISNGQYLNRLLNFSNDIKIVMWMGGVHPLSGALELARDAQGWPADYRLVFHFRTQTPSSYMREIMECQSKGHVYITNSPIPYSEIDNLVASVSVGLGLYENTGINARYICLSSGKINSFLKMGIPCIVNDFEGLRWVEDLGVGICIESSADVLEATKKIIKDYEKYRKRCIEVFESLLNFDKSFSLIAEEIEKAIT